MRIILAIFSILFASTLSSAQSKVPFRVAIVGLVHGHVGGFFVHSAEHPDIQLVGIAEPDGALFRTYAAAYHIDGSLYYSSLEEMLQKARPMAVLVYTNTFDHRKVVEECARRGVHVMMEK